MRTLKSLVLVLVLAVAACRSVPSDVATAHQTSKTESAAALTLAEGTLQKIEDKSAELNDASVTAAYNEWAAHVAKIREARAVVAKYLVDTSAGPDLTGPYQVANQILADMDTGFGLVNLHWQEMLEDGRAADAAEFRRLFRRDIERYRILQRKFDEWISQFRVKD